MKVKQCFLFGRQIELNITAWRSFILARKVGEEFKCFDESALEAASRKRGTQGGKPKTGGRESHPRKVKGDFAFNGGKVKGAFAFAFNRGKVKKFIEIEFIFTHTHTTR